MKKNIISKNRIPYKIKYLIYVYNLLLIFSHKFYYEWLPQDQCIPVSLLFATEKHDPDELKIGPLEKNQQRQYEVSIQSLVSRT